MLERSTDARRVEFDLPAGWSHVQVATSPSGGRDLFVFGPGGVDRCTLAPADPRPVRVVAAAYPAEPPRGPPEALPLLVGDFDLPAWGVDLDRDGWLDLLAPIGSGEEAAYAIHLGGPRDFRRAGEIVLPVRRPHPAWVPALLPVDYDGDGRIDLVAAGSRSVHFLPAGAIRPVAAIAAPGGRTRAAAADLDGDGLPEFVLAGETGDVYRVHRGRAGGAPRPEPDVEIPAGGDHRFGPFLVDSDGDGIRDLAYVAIDEPSAAGAITGAVLSGSIPFEVRVVTHPGRGGQLPAPGEVRTRSFDARIDRALLEGDGPEVYERARAVADLDGDGRLDGIVLDASDDLAIHYGLEGVPATAASALDALVARTIYVSLDAASEIEERAPDRTIDVPPAFEPRRVAVATADLDGDGHHDLALYEPRGAPVVVVLSSGPPAP